MGSTSKPANAARVTPEAAIDKFVADHAMFRSELDSVERRCFDYLARRARHYSGALAKRPLQDYERPILLAFVLEAFHVQDVLRRDLDKLRAHTDETVRILEETGLVCAKVKSPSADERYRNGQSVLSTFEDRL